MSVLPMLLLLLLKKRPVPLAHTPCVRSSCLFHLNIEALCCFRIDPWRVLPELGCWSDDTCTGNRAGNSVTGIRVEHRLCCIGTSTMWEYCSSEVQVWCVPSLFDA